jgi:HPt (histidine-containing phosphotransfer) domain-containing protein
MNSAARESNLLFSTLSSDPDLCEIVEMFVAEMPERIGRLLEHYQSGNLAELTRCAHQLKGAAGSYGFEPITECAAKLEADLRQSEPEDKIHADVDALTDICRRARSGTAE